MDMTEFLIKLQHIHLTKQRRREAKSRANDRETELFRSLAVSFLWLGSAVLPQASLVASFMQQKDTKLLVCDLIDANSHLKQLRETTAQIKFNVPNVNNDITICSFPEATFNISA